MATSRRKKRRRGSRRPKTGIYVSIKSGNKYRYRSNWEKVYMQYLDSNDDIVEWLYECIKIPYVSNKKTGKIRTYTPDFCVIFKDEKKAIIEVKPKSKLTKATIIKKAQAAREWCAKTDAEYIFVTEIELKALGLL